MRGMRTADLGWKASKEKGDEWMDTEGKIGFSWGSEKKNGYFLLIQNWRGPHASLAELQNANDIRQSEDKDRDKVQRLRIGGTQCGGSCVTIATLICKKGKETFGWHPAKWKYGNKSEKLKIRISNSLSIRFSRWFTSMPTTHTKENLSKVKMSLVERFVNVFVGPPPFPPTRGSPPGNAIEGGEALKKFMIPISAAVA